MLPVNKDSFTSFLKSLYLLFLFLAILHWLGPPIKMLNRSCERVDCCLFRGRMFIFWPLSMMLIVASHRCSFSGWGCFLLVLADWEILGHMFFLHILKWSAPPPLYCINVVNYSDWFFSNIKPTLQSWDVYPTYWFLSISLILSALLMLS